MRRYVLYGAAAIGGLVKKAIEAAGATVIGYLDKRAFELKEYNGIPVYSLSQFPRNFYDDDIVLFISVKNVFEHEKIANDLYGRGLRNIVYKPYNVLIGKGTEEENALADLYDKIMDGRLENAVTEIPQCLGEGCQTLYDYAEIEKKGEEIVAYIPVEFVFTNNYVGSGMAKWGNVPIAGLFTHINFFKSLSGDITASVDSYVEEYCVYTAGLHGNIKITNAWRENVVENRSQIYEQMRDARDIDPDFFVRNASTAEWNDKKKYFNLTSGKHRCSFLVSQGVKYIPLRISQNDYESFANRKYAEEIAKNLYNLKGECIVPNPFFYRGTFVRDRGNHNFLLWFTGYYAEKLYRKYGRVDFSKLSVMDLEQDYGHMSRYLNRIGIKVQRMNNKDKIEQQLNRLFYSTVDYECRKDMNVVIVDAEDIDKLKTYKDIEFEEIILRNADEEEEKSVREQYGLCNSTLIDKRKKSIRQVGDYLLNDRRSEKYGE